MSINYDLDDKYIQCVFYIFSNFNPSKRKIANKKILFLPGITICRSVESLQSNVDLICAALTNSARINFKNNKILFDNRIAILGEVSIDALAADIFGPFETPVH